MARKPTYPVIFDQCDQLIISDLLKLGYLAHNNSKSGKISWSRNGIEVSSISITSNTKVESPYLELAYFINKQLIKYRIQLTTLPSNLGKGELWYFICPKTGKRCRKLHFVNDYFYHRTAFRNCFYETQILSPYDGHLKKLFEHVFRRDRINEQLHSKNFKSYYAGKPTKRFLCLTNKIEASAVFLHEEYQMILSNSRY